MCTIDCTKVLFLMHGKQEGNHTPYRGEVKYVGINRFESVE
jgi:hypothetical protein